MKTALITGITGQDGSYLAEHLLSLGYRVYGLVRRTSTPNLGNIAGILDKITLLSGDLADQGSLDRAVATACPDEVYNLAAQSFVQTSFEQPELTANITGLGALRVFEACRKHAFEARIYQASSSEMFGNSLDSIQSEETILSPRSPYGAAKVFAHHMARNYREAYGMYISCGILFNHESPRRGIEFVTRKIAHGVAALAAGKIDTLRLGNPNAERDWGFAPDYVAAMHFMLQESEPDDYVIATGKKKTVWQFAQLACRIAGVDPAKIAWNMSSRAAELHSLCGDPTKAERVLGWKSAVQFDELVRLMVTEELRKLNLRPVEEEDDELDALESKFSGHE